MRKTIAAILAVLCLLTSFGCQQQQGDKRVVFDVGLEDNTSHSYPEEARLYAEELLTDATSETTEVTANTTPVINTTAETTVEEETTDPPQSSCVNKEKISSKAKSNEPKTSPSQPAPTPTVPQVTQPDPAPTTTTPVSTEPKKPTPEAETTVPTPAQPQTKPTNAEENQPETKPTVPETKPTEPTGCTHDWKTIHHEEKGHWKAGIVCDCGWTVYGKADELVSKWNAHSAAYPVEEALFKHGGYGSADKWIVDAPAYDEWVCRNCGVQKE